MRIWALIVAIAMLSAGCDGGGDQQPEQADVSTTATPPVATDATTGPTARSPRLRVVFLGDSLTAGYGVERDESYPAVVSEMLKKDGFEVDAVNAGVSGDTTAGGLRRIDWLLKQKPDVVVVGLGGNDGLRGLDLKESENNLRQIVTKAKSGGAKVLLLGMLIPPNYGPDYTKNFQAIYPRLAKELDVPLVPFLLEGVGGELKYNQRDGIHPTADGHRVVAKNVEPFLREMVGSQRVKHDE